MRLRDEIDALKIAVKVAHTTSEADAVVIQKMRDEIEGLRTENERLEAENERLLAEFG